MRRRAVAFCVCFPVFHHRKLSPCAIGTGVFFCRGHAEDCVFFSHAPAELSFEQCSGERETVPDYAAGHTGKQKDTEEGMENETRIALIGIVVEKPEAAAEVNRILHDYAAYIIGRMGIPYKPREISIISIVLDAENNVISSLSGKLGMVRGIHVKTMYSKQ